MDFLTFPDSAGGPPVVLITKVRPSLPVALIDPRSRVIVRSRGELMLADRLFGSARTQGWQAPADLRVLAQSKDTFVVLVVGAVPDSAPGQRLRDAWAMSPLGADSRCRLTFGSTANDAPSPDIVVRLEGCASSQTLDATLASIDHGVATVVFGGPALAPLHMAVAWVLHVDATPAQISRALEILWREPAIRFHLQRNPFVDADAFVAMGDAALRASGALSCSKSTDLTPARPPRRRLYVDVTEVAARDLRTGIQRGVRAQLLELLDAPPPDTEVRPVSLVSDGEVWWWVFADRYLKQISGTTPAGIPDAPILPNPGDIIYLPDLHPIQVAAAHRAGAFRALRSHGVSIHAIVCDLLPFTLPHCFPPGADFHHEAWLRALVTDADQLICISETVAVNVRDWIRTHMPHVGTRPHVTALHLGADIASSHPSGGMPEDAAAILAAMRAVPTFLMVGSIEPRKGHLQALAAFDLLWNEGVDVNLVVVGRDIWLELPDEMRRTVPRIIKILTSHASVGKRLFWFNAASDEYLEAIYDASVCLVAASEDEGFGLPLIEAAHHGLPIIARDVAIMREVTAGHAFFFDGAEPEVLATALREWLRLHADGKAPGSTNMPFLTWRENVERLKALFPALEAGRA